MPRAVTALSLVVFLCFGCTQTAKDVHTNVDDPLATSESTSDELGQIQAGVDAAAALYDFGDIADFLAVRDSLRMQLEQIAGSYPSMRSEPEFNRILESLDDLDSLDIVQTYSRRTMDTEDSLALAMEEWPDLDSTQVEVGALSFSDTLFPYFMNDRIEFWIRYFTGPGKERFARSLYRMQLHRPVVEQVLTELELPHELICVGLIESGFHLKARSRARAVGPWQFVAGTARIYGLRVNWWYDERRDIVASTYAAGNYLSDLYSIWSSWPLALAAYNCGEYRVARAVARHKTDNFWKLRLPKQTERYVPKFLATLYILRDPEAYGFTMPKIEPVKFDEVTIEDATDIKVIAEAASTTVDVLRDFNPALLRWTTPPKMEISVKVPVGSGSVCKQRLDAIPPSERVTWRKHRIRQGETLSRIAGRYGTSVPALKELNGIRNAHRISAGTYLIVPIQGSFHEVASSKPEYKTKRRNVNKKALEEYAKRYEPPSNHKRVIYVVKDRDTLGEIAEVYRTRASKIRAWNDLAYRSYIYPGQKLVIYVPDSFDLSKVQSAPSAKPRETDHYMTKYTVRKGDTIYSISKRYNVSMADLLAWNNKTSRSVIYPGQNLEIWQKK